MRRPMPAADVLIVSLGSTAGLRAADDELAGALRRARARRRRSSPRAAPRELRTFALTDLAWARAARAAARRGIAAHDPRAVVYSTVTAALLWPRAGRDPLRRAGGRATAPAATALWQRPLERRRLREAPLLVPWTRRRWPRRRARSAEAIVVPIPVEPSPAPGGARATSRRSRTPRTRTRRASIACSPRGRAARRDGEELVVAGADLRIDAPGVRVAGRLAPAAYRALLRRARVFVTAPRREDYGIAQLEALADGCVLVTTAAPGPYAALPLARALDPRLVVARRRRRGLAGALRTALDDAGAGLRRSARPRRSRRSAATRSTRSCATSCCRGCWR